MFDNPGKSDIDAFLRRIGSIAILGLSETPGKPSHNVAKALQKFGYRIVPVNPDGHGNSRRARLAGPRVGDEGRRARSTWSTCSGGPNTSPAIVDDCIRLKVPALWLQEGVIDEAAAQKARDAGIFTVMDRCMFRDRSSAWASRADAQRHQAHRAQQAGWLDVPAGRVEAAGTSALTRLMSRMIFHGDLAQVQVADAIRRQIGHFDLEHVAARLERAPSRTREWQAPGRAQRFLPLSARARFRARRRGRAAIRRRAAPAHRTRCDNARCPRSACASSSASVVQLASVFMRRSPAVRASRDELAAATRPAARRLRRAAPGSAKAATSGRPCAAGRCARSPTHRTPVADRPGVCGP